MKKKLESELVSIAHRILKLKGKEDVVKMHDEVKVLFEKLSVLKFAYENFEEDDIPTIGGDSSFFGMLDSSFNNKVSDSIEIEDKIYVNLDDERDEDIMEPVMETIKDMVSQMPDPQENVDTMPKPIEQKKQAQNNDFETLTEGFKNMPVFEPVSKVKLSQDKKSLNDKLKSGGISIGLNDKIAFIKHLFDGKHEDYDRVLSQLNTLSSFEEASNLILNIVKPDYNNWEGKEEFEERFMDIIESKFI